MLKISLALLLILPSTSFAASFGTCRTTSEDRAKHIFFMIDTGRKLLLDLSVFKKKALTIPLINKQLKISADIRTLLDLKVKKCEFVLSRQDKAVTALTKVNTRLETDNKKLTSDLFNAKTEISELKLARWKWLVIGVAIGIVAGGIAGYFIGDAIGRSMMTVGLAK